MWVAIISKFIELLRKIAEAKRNVYFSAQLQISRSLSLQPFGTVLLLRYSSKDKVL